MVKSPLSSSSSAMSNRREPTDRYTSSTVFGLMRETKGRTISLEESEGESHVRRELGKNRSRNVFVLSFSSVARVVPAKNDACVHARARTRACVCVYNVYTHARACTHIYIDDVNKRVKWLERSARDKRNTRPPQPPPSPSPPIGGSDALVFDRARVDGRTEGHEE